MTLNRSESLGSVAHTTRVVRAQLYRRSAVHDERAIPVYRVCDHGDEYRRVCACVCASCICFVCAERTGEERMQLHISCFEIHNNCVLDLLQSRRIEGVVVDDITMGPTECGVTREYCTRLSQVRHILPSCDPPRLVERAGGGSLTYA